MNIFLEVAPGVALVWVSMAAAIPARLMLRASGRGRARSAIAYLSGFFVGIGTSVLLCLLLGTVVPDEAPRIETAGLIGALLGPLLGMARAKWLGPIRRKPSRAAKSADHSLYAG